MSDTTQDTQELVTPAETTENTDESQSEVVEEAVEQPKKETAPTIAEVIQKQETKNDSVPLAVHLEQKKEVKALKQALKDLETKVSEGASKKEVSSDIAELGKKFQVDPDFLAELSTAIRNGAREDALGEVESVLRPLQEKERDAAIDKVFTEHFGKAMDTMPEYKDVVNPAVIKTLSLQPSNANKTFAQLIEETYGNAISGKRTIESTVPGGGKEPESLDYERAAKDMDYFKSVMASPKLKAEYNARMLEKGF